MTGDRGRWRILALLATAELLGMSLWFTASAASPYLRAAWGLDDAQTAWLTGAVQLGFVAGTALAALLNLADVWPARAFFAGSALLAATANALLLVAPGYEAALALRFATGLLLAGVYPPAMKMVSTWFREARGLAIGTVVGALTLGKALPYLVRAIGPGSLAPVVLAASAGGVLAAILVAGGYRDGPYAFPRRPFAWGRVAEVVRSRRARLAIGGYLGHMWELYAAWTWAPIFFSEYFSRRMQSPAAEAIGAATGFLMIGVGGIGCVMAGLLGDRIGKAKVASGAMLISATCSVAIGWTMSAPVWLVITIAVIWGASVVADSAQFSALVTETAPASAVGTALTLQTSVGFLLTTVSIWAVVPLRGLGGWPLAFAILGVGPLLGILALRRLGADTIR